MDIFHILLLHKRHTICGGVVQEDAFLDDFEREEEEVKFVKEREKKSEEKGEVSKKKEEVSKKKEEVSKVLKRKGEIF